MPNATDLPTEVLKLREYLRESCGRERSEEAILRLVTCLELARRWPTYQPMPSAARAQTRLGLHRHYKGGVYTAIAVVRHHESRQPMMLYVCHETGSLNVRSLYPHDGDPDAWFSNATLPNGGVAPRFAPIPTEDEESALYFR